MLLWVMGVHGMKCVREVLRAAYREVIFLLLIQGFQRKKKKLGTWRLFLRFLLTADLLKPNLLIVSISCNLNNCQSFMKNLVNNVVILLCLVFEFQTGVYSIFFLWCGASERIMYYCSVTRSLRLL